MAKTSGSIRGNKHPKEISLDEYLGKRGLQSPISNLWMISGGTSG